LDLHVVPREIIKGHDRAVNVFRINVLYYTDVEERIKLISSNEEFSTQQYILAGFVLG
jgi:hypothetical protein